MIRSLLLALILAVPALSAPQDAICRVSVQGRTSNSIGSGALVDWHGVRYVVTNWHVVNERTANDAVTVTWPSEGRPRRALVLLTDNSDDADLAVLAVEGDTSNLEALQVAETDAVSEAYVGGFGGTGQLRVVNARVGSMGPWYLLGQPVRSGDSGGPVFTARGLYIGAVWGSGGDLPNGSLAVRLGPVRRILLAVSRGIQRVAIPTQYRVCPPGGCPTRPVYSGGGRPVYEVKPQAPLEPVQRAPACDPDCCDGLKEQIAELATLSAKLGEQVEQGFVAIDGRFTKIGVRLDKLESREECVDCTPQLVAISQRLDALETRVASDEQADPFPVYYTLVADQGAEYWPRLRGEYARASEAFQGIRLAPPPASGVGQLPRLVAFRAGTPLGNVGGSREVSDALRLLSQGESPRFY